MFLLVSHRYQCSVSECNQSMIVKSNCDFSEDSLSCNIQNITASDSNVLISFSTINRYNVIIVNRRTRALIRLFSIYISVNK